MERALTVEQWFELRKSNVKCQVCRAALPSHVWWGVYDHPVYVCYSCRSSMQPHFQESRRQMGLIPTVPATERISDETAVHDCTADDGEKKAKAN